MSAVSPIPPSVAPPVMVVCLAQLPGTNALFSRGGGAYGTPPSSRTPRIDPDQPPIGVVVGAGAVGALAGEGKVNENEIFLRRVVCFLQDNFKIEFMTKKKLARRGSLLTRGIYEMIITRRSRARSARQLRKPPRAGRGRRGAVFLLALLLFMYLAYIKISGRDTGQVCLLCRHSLVLTCVACLEIYEEQLYSFRGAVKTDIKSVRLWKTSPSKYYKYDPSG